MDQFDFLVATACRAFVSNLVILRSRMKARLASLTAVTSSVVSRSIPFRRSDPKTIVHQSSGERIGCHLFSAITSTASAPPSLNICRSPFGSAILSQGLDGIGNSDRSSRTDRQNRPLAGSRTFRPHVVMANFPPGRTRRHSCRTAASMFGEKKIPKNTHHRIEAFR